MMEVFNGKYVDWLGWETKRKNTWLCRLVEKNTILMDSANKICKFHFLL